MIGLEDRRSLAQDIQVAHQAGARLHLACEVAGIDVRTLQRWRAGDGLACGDGRPQAVHPTPGHALSPAEREQILRVANEPRFADMPPARIVPALADEGVYLASESSFHRVLRAHGQTQHRGRAKPPRASRPPTTHVATAPRPGVVLGHDLPACAGGRALVLPVPDHGPVQPQDRGLRGPRRRRLGACHAVAQAHGAGRGHPRHGQQARAARRQRRHAEGHHGAGDAELAGREASYSRPRVSDDNAFVESLFRTAKYRPEFPSTGFADLEAARAWATGFVHWYNWSIATAASATSRRHSATQGKTAPSWLPVIRHISRHANVTPLAGQGILATGHRSASSRSIPSETPSSVTCRLKIKHGWLHESGDNYLDLLRMLEPGRRITIATRRMPQYQAGNTVDCPINAKPFGLGCADTEMLLDLCNKECPRLHCAASGGLPGWATEFVFLRIAMTALRSFGVLSSLCNLRARSSGVSSNLLSFKAGFAPLPSSILTSSAELANTAPCNGKSLSIPARLTSSPLPTKNFNSSVRSDVVDSPCVTNNAPMPCCRMSMSSLEPRKFNRYLRQSCFEKGIFNPPRSAHRRRSSTPCVDIAYVDKPM
jgi:putative transposase